jgi:hypothetical protein
VIGRTLSSYRVIEKLGEGGMGAVYLARDERLGRDVALKVLPELMLGDETARTRFRKEAQALLRLSHPHVATLLDFGSENGTDYLVMERVSGPTLDVVRLRGALPEKEVIRLGTQLARGLKAAHEAGVVHRDLKPSNLALTPDAMLKILDFGLAWVEKQPGPGETTSVPTSPGALVGTPPYMAPEQLRGEGTDVRTDVYGAGAVLYELATGRRLFEGKKGAELTSAILTEAPALPRTVVSSVSSGLEAVILKALDKDRDLRYQSARELLVDLERLERGSPSASLEASHKVGYLLRPLRIAWACAAAALVVLGAWLLLPAPVPRITQVTRIVGGLGKFPDTTWATDGVRIYYVGWKGGQTAVFQVSANGGQPAEIPVALGGVRWVFGFAERESALLLAADLGPSFQGMGGLPLWLVPVPTGAPRRLGDLRGWSAALSPDGRRVAVHGTKMLVARSDGSDVQEVGLGSLRIFRRWAQWSPDGRSLRVRAMGPDGNGLWIWDVPLDGGSVRPLWPGYRATWNGDGRYSILQPAREGGDIYAVREAASWLRGPSEPKRLTFGPLRFENPAPSRDGRRLFAFGTIERQALMRYDSATGRFSPHLGGGPASQVAASRDGQWLAWIRLPDNTLWRSRSDGSQPLQLTGAPLRAAVPRWSPDGRRIVFAGAAPGEPLTLWLVSPEGGEPQPLGGWPTGLVKEGPTDLWDPCWLLDGRTLVYSMQWSWFAGLFRMDVETKKVTLVPGGEDLQFPKCGPQGQILAVFRPRGQGLQQGLRVLWPGREQWEDVGPLDWHWPDWSRDGQSIIGLNPASQWIERRSLRTRRVERLADTADRRLESVNGLLWMGLDAHDAPLVVEDQSTSDLYALDWEAP